MTDVVGAASHGRKFCGARKRQGEGTCERPAGWGTPHPGSGACKLHGGTMQNHLIAAGRQKAAVVARRGDLRDVDPHTVLLEEVQRSAGAVAVLEPLVRQIGEIVTDSDRGLLAEWHSERRASVVASKTAIDAGIAVWRVELEQGRVSMQVEGMRAGMDAVGMSEPDRRVFVEAMLARLRVIGGDDESEG